MVGAQLNAPNEIVLAEVETPSVSSGDLLLKVKTATICGTDIRIYRGKKTKGVRFPSIIGHEFSGEVVDVAKDVATFSKGDRICVDPVIPCGSCQYCLSGMENVCANRRAIGYEFNGAFAEYVRIPAEAVSSGNVRKIPQHVSWESAALAEPLACCINGQEKIGVDLGDTVVVIGAGPIGLMHVRLAKASGAGRVIVSELHQHRRETSLSFGADLVSDPETDDLKSVVDDATNGLGADVVILAIGVPQLAETALSLARKGGRVSLFAGFAPQAKAQMDPNLIHYSEILVTGASALTRKQYGRALEMVSRKEFGIDQLVTHRFELKDIAEALQVAESGEASLKVAIVP